MILTGKVIVVTGAGSGIGRQLVLQLCQRGACVAAVDYNPDALAETAELAGRAAGELSQHVVDVSEVDQVMALPEEVMARHSRIDGLVNNAGIIHAHGSIEALPPEQVERVFSVNWWGTYHMVKAFLPMLRDRPEAALVNVSSMGGFMPFPDQVAYGASKAAVKLLTEGLRVELKRDSNICISLVYPGAVQTDITENSPDIGQDYKQSVRKLGQDKPVGVTSEAAARKIVRGIEKRKPRILVGPDSWFLDKLYRLMPLATASMMSWIMGKALDDELLKLHRR